MYVYIYICVEIDHSSSLYRYRRYTISKNQLAMGDKPNQKHGTLLMNLEHGYSLKKTQGIIGLTIHHHLNVMFKIKTWINMAY